MPKAKDEAFKRSLTYSQWAKRYQPRDALEFGCNTQPGDVQIDDFYTAKKHDPNADYVWTIIEGDNGNLYLGSGFHVVNRIAYVICKVPHDGTLRGACYF